MGVVFFQHASADVEKMVLGNKCDMEDRRQVSKERGEQVLYLRFFLKFSAILDHLLINITDKHSWVGRGGRRGYMTCTSLCELYIQITSSY